MNRIDSTTYCAILNESETSSHNLDFVFAEGTHQMAENLYDFSITRLNYTIIHECKNLWIMTVSSDCGELYE